MIEDTLLGQVGTGVRRRIRASSVLLSLAILLVAGVVPAGASFGDGTGVNRFSVVRTRTILIRVDTHTGQTWVVPPDGDGGWMAVGGAASGPEGSRDGRYDVKVLSAPKPSFGPASADPVDLIRMDAQTGRAWTIKAVPGAEWVELSEAAGETKPGAAP